MDVKNFLKKISYPLIALVETKVEDHNALKVGYFNDIERMAVQVMECWNWKEQIIFCEEARKAFEEKHHT
ncbi:hypothetical protein QJS10_CPB21g01607 [Acorus calamus]|uniref:Uncharacterized protein n=1 Tax=Acorus calamus TaxID=4465 RepID=A0AAV9C373_ACOCL|nr:hypothetical protein QJS10_CPB21g01607 [Acorus calamus]